MGVQVYPNKNTTFLVSSFAEDARTDAILNDVDAFFVAGSSTTQELEISSNFISEGKEKSDLGSRYTRTCISHVYNYTKIHICIITDTLIYIRILTSF